MTPDALRHIGEALYGPLWQASLAAELNVSDRTLRHWVSGKYPVPDGVPAELAELCLIRAERLKLMAKQLGRL